MSAAYDEGVAEARHHMAQVRDSLQQAELALELGDLTKALEHLTEARGTCQNAEEDVVWVQAYASGFRDGRAAAQEGEAAPATQGDQTPEKLNSATVPG